MISRKPPAIALATCLLLSTGCQPESDDRPDTSRNDTGARDTAQPSPDVRKDSSPANDATQALDGPSIDGGDVCARFDYYRDADGDGFGDPATETYLCESADTSGYVSNSKDCDDTDPQIHPQAQETCDDVDNDCDGHVDGWALNCPDVKLIGSTKRDEALSVDAYLSHSSFWVSGTTDGGLNGTTSAGGSDFFLARYDARFERQTFNQFGTTDDDAFLSANANAGELIGVGQTEGTLANRTNTGKLDSFVATGESVYGEAQQGPNTWMKTIGTSEDDKVVGSTRWDRHSIWVTGTTWGDLAGQTNQGNGDGFLAHYAANGTLEEIKVFGTSAVERVADVGAESSGNSDGGVYLTGTTEGDLGGQSNAGQTDVFLTMYDSQAQQNWVTLLGSPAVESVHAIHVTDTPDFDRIFVVGSTEGSVGTGSNSGGTDAFVACFDFDGNQKWIRQFGTSKEDVAHGVTFGPTNPRTGAIYITGSTEAGLSGGQNAGKSDVFLAKFNQSGSRQWLHLIGTPEADVGADLTFVNDRPVVVGSTEGSLDGQSANGDKDAFIAK